MRKEVITDTEDLRITRVVYDTKPELSLMKDITVEWGSVDDWHALSDLHYKGHSLAAGSRFMRCVYRENGQGDGEVIGVMVIANPRALDSGRNAVFPKLRPNVNGRDTRIVNRARLQWINRRLAWNNRTVLDTMYRSAGIAYRFKNLAYRMYCANYGRVAVESRSSMGRFNPFSVKSGMRFIKPKLAAALNDGLQFFSGHFKAHPGDIVAVEEELRAMPEDRRVYTERRLREFYYRWSAVEKSGEKRGNGMSRINALETGVVLRQIMQLVFSATVYWVWFAVDKEGSLPRALPLSAFDEQGPNEPLKRDWSGWKPEWFVEQKTDDVDPSEETNLDEMLNEYEVLSEGGKL